MTAVMEPRASLQEQHPEAFAEMLREQEMFDATRPPCPDFCNGECETFGHFGTAIMHVSDDAETPTDSSLAGHDCGTLRVRAIRYEQLDGLVESQVEILLDAAEGVFEDSAEFTPAQARQLAAQLLRHADLLKPDLDAPAEEIRVGDWLSVDGDWRYVYGIAVDEPSDMVQVFTTVDRDKIPEVGEGLEEYPQRFKFGQATRIRRSAGGQR